MFRNGLKTIIALLPAGAALGVAFLVRGVPENQGLWTLIIFGLVILGGILAASFITGATTANRPSCSFPLICALFAVVFFTYVGVFFLVRWLVVMAGLSGT